MNEKEKEIQENKTLALLRENYNLLLKNIRSLQDVKEIQETIDKEIIKLDELKKQIQELQGGIPAKVEITNQKEFPKEIEVKNFPVQKEFPKSFEISNLEKIKIPEFPKKIEAEDKGFIQTIKELGLIKTFLGKISEKINNFKQIDSVFIRNKTTDEAIPVKLADKDGKRFYNAIASAISAGSPDVIKIGTPAGDSAMDETNDALRVNVVAGGAGNGAILDGVDSNIKATVKDLTNSNPLIAAIVDANGDQITSFGGGTQYSDGDANADPTGTVAMGTDGSNIFALHTDTAGDLQIDVLTMPTVAVTGTFWQATQPVSAASLPLPSGAATSALQGAGLPAALGAGGGVKIDGSGTALPVSLASVPSHAVTNAGTFAVQAAEADGANVTLGAKADAKSTATDTTAITIMQVLKQISASVQAPPSQAVTFTGSTDVATQTTLAAINAKLVTGTVIGDVNLGATDNAVLDAIEADTTTIATDTTAIKTAIQIMDDWDNGASDGASVSGDVAHDSPDAGEPVKVGFKAVLFNQTAPPAAAVAEDDRVNGIADEYGRQYINDVHPNFWDVSVDYASAQTNASVKAAPGAGLSLYITDISISNGAVAGNITLLDGSGGTVKYEIYPAINGGAVDNKKIPIKLTANTALCITSTTVTTHSLNISGFIAP